MLSTKLKQDLIWEMYLDYIIKCPLFIDLGEQQIYDIVRHLKTDIYNPDDYVYKKGDCHKVTTPLNSE